MSGIKGRSGRRGSTDEQKRIRIIDKAWEVVNEYLYDESIPLKERVEIAIKVVVKNVPSQVDVEGLVEYVKMGKITIDDQPQELNIGDPVISSAVEEVVNENGTPENT